MVERCLAKNNLMKKSFLNFSHFFTLVLLLFLSCTNRYEKKAIGQYQVDTYERKDSTNKEKINLPASLTLKDNKTFLLLFKDSTIKGKWTANDYGDWTLVEFVINKNKVQAQLGIDEISIINPYEFNCTKLKLLVFKRVNKK